jgi:hypothetical protein
MSNLTTLLGVIASELSDPDKTRWSTDDLTRHLRAAMAAWSSASPRIAIATVETAAGAREVDLSSCVGLMEVLDVWYPYDPADPVWPPTRPAWSLLDAATLLLEVDDLPAGANDAQVRLRYAADHTLEDLDGAETTTLNAQGEQAVCLVAGALAALQRAQAVIGTVTPHESTPAQYMAWAAARCSAYQALARAAQRRAALVGDGRVAWGAGV